MNRCFTALILFFGLLTLSGSAAADGHQTLCRDVMENETCFDGKRPSLILTVEDDGRAVNVRAGETIRVDLEFQGGTGFNWYPEGLDSGLLAFTGRETREQPGGPMAGGPVLGSWYFTALAPGDTVLGMLYYRVWEGKEHAAKKFEVKIEIAGKR